MSDSQLIFLSGRGRDEQNTAHPRIGRLSLHREALHPHRVGRGDQGVGCAEDQSPLADWLRSPYILGESPRVHPPQCFIGWWTSRPNGTDQKFFLAFPVNPSQALTHHQHLQRVWGSKYARYVRLLHTAVRRPFLRTISSPRVAEGTSSPSPNRAPCSPSRTRAGSPRSTYTPCDCPGTAATKAYSLEHSYQHTPPTNNTPPPGHHRLPQSSVARISGSIQL